MGWAGLAGLADVANENTGHPVKTEFQINKFFQWINIFNENQWTKLFIV